MNFKALATTALISSTLLFTPQAKASGCYPSLAISDMEAYLAGGASLNEAWNYVTSENNVQKNKVCWLKFSGYSKRLPLTYPYTHRAIWK